MTNKKSESKKDIVVTCDKTYVSEKCSRSAYIENQRNSRRSSTTSPSQSPAYAQEVPLSRHHRRGAIRGKRSVSLKTPRPVEQREDNPYVDTSFVDVPLRPATPNRAFIDFSTVSEELLNKPVGPNAKEVGDGVPYFPPYASWNNLKRNKDKKKTENVMPNALPPVMCKRCKECRCKECQRRCKWLRLTVCGMSVPTYNWTRFLPCVSSNARSLVCSSHEEPERSTWWYQNVGPCSDKCRPGQCRRDAALAEASEREHEDPLSLRCWLCSLFCCCFPYLWRGGSRSRRCPSECSYNCGGNADVPNCRCVDWDALYAYRQRTRNAIAANAAAASSSKSSSPSPSTYRQHHRSHNQSKPRPPTLGRDRNNTSSTMRTAANMVPNVAPSSSASIFGRNTRRMAAAQRAQDECIAMQPLSTRGRSNITFEVIRTSGPRPESDAAPTAAAAAAAPDVIATIPYADAPDPDAGDRHEDIETASSSSASGIDPDISNSSLVTVFGVDKFDDLPVAPLAAVDNDDLDTDADTDDDDDGDESDNKVCFVDTAKDEFYHSELNIVI